METKNSEKVIWVSKFNQFGATAKGFTLIELLVVIAIIGLLASVVLVALNGSRQKSRDTKRAADIAQLSQAMELFYNSFNSYPTTTAATGPGIFTASSASCTSGTNGCVNYLVPTFLAKIPPAPLPADNPSSSTACSGSYGGATGNDYQYSANNTSPANSYAVTFCIGGQVGNLAPGIHTLTPAGIQ